MNLVYNKKIFKATAFKSTNLKHGNSQAKYKAPLTKSDL